MAGGQRTGEAGYFLPSSGGAFGRVSPSMASASLAGSGSYAVLSPVSLLSSVALWFPDWTLIHLDCAFLLLPPDCVSLIFDSGPAKGCCIHVVPQARLCPISIPHPFLPLWFHMNILCPLLPLFPKPIQSLPFKAPLKCHLLHEVHLDCCSLTCTGSSELH